MAFFSAPLSPSAFAWNSSSMFPPHRIQHRPIAGRHCCLPRTTPRSRIEGNFLNPRLSIHRAFLFPNPRKNRRERVIPQAGRSKQRPKRPDKRLSTGKLKDNAEKKKPAGPYRKQPDEFYKFGPFGPYSYKAPVVGTIQPITSPADDYVFMWSTLSNLQEIEEVDIYNASVSYDRRVQTFDETVGLQFFYVFVRLPFKYENQALWKEWSLVSEITVESGEVLDKAHLSSRLTLPIKNRITTYTGWIRPDLVYVRKPRYQVRFEPQLEFIDGLKRLLFEAAGTVHENDSYYGVFCKILGVDVDASHEEIISAYENASEETRLACLEHLFSMHPVKLMYHVPYPHSRVWMKNEGSASSNKGKENEASTLGGMDREQQGGMYSDTYGGTDSEIEIDDWAGDENESENDEVGSEDRYGYGSDGDDDGNGGNWDGRSENTYDNESESVDLDNESENDDMGNESEDDDMGNESENDDVVNESENEDEWDASSANVFRKNRSRKGNLSISEDDMTEEDTHEMADSESKRRPFLKAAARPYTYVNFIREMVLLREMLLERKKEGVEAQ